MTIASRPGWQKGLLALCLALIAFGIGWWLAGLPGSGTDYYFTFRPMALDWLAGRTRINDGPAGGGGFYHSPWSIAVIALFAVWDFRFGLALMSALTLLMLAASVWWFSAQGYGVPGSGASSSGAVSHGRPLALAFALFNLHTMELIFRGQLSGFEVFGVALGWLAYRRMQPWLMGAGYVLMSLVPPNSIPVALFFIWLTWRSWPRRDWLTSLVLPMGVVLSSFVIFGWWPERWLTNLRVQPAPPHFQVTLWRMAVQLDLPLVIPLLLCFVAVAAMVRAWRRTAGRDAAQTDLARLMLVIATTFMVTPYSMGYRLVPLLACVMPYLSRWRLDVLIGLYLLTFIPLSRIFIGQDNAWIDMIFVTAVFIATIFYTGRAGRNVTQFDPRNSALGTIL
jgi:hypothetical protein